MHWGAKYIGLPYVPGARGPKSVDCWGLLCLAYKNEFNIALPTFEGVIGLKGPGLTVARDELKAEWEIIEKPMDGAAVGMVVRGSLGHVGLFLDADGGKVLHCSDYKSVVADTLKKIQSRGPVTFVFYRHILWPL